MATIKSYTDIEQSKRLAEILPLESADRTYRPIMDIDSMSNSGFLDIPECFPFNDFKNSIIKPLPCWSLAALLSVLPKYIGGSVLRMDMGENDFSLWFDDLSNIVDEILPDITKDNPVDACVEMILKLHELKML